MPNTNYNKGVKKERLFVNEARAAGLLAFRSAGSHSPIDVVIVDHRVDVIQFVQCKPDSMSLTEKEKLRAALPRNGYYWVQFNIK